MRVVVHYMAQVKQAAGRTIDEIELEHPCTVRELIIRLADNDGGSLRRLLLDKQGDVQPALLVFVGDEQVSAGQTVILQDGDVVTVLSPMAGG